MRRNHGLQQGDTTIERSGFQTKAATVRQSGMLAGGKPDLCLSIWWWTVPASRSSAKGNGSRRSIKSREYAAAGANSTSDWTWPAGAIVCADLTHDDVGDSTALPGLLDQFDAPVTGFLADGAYDGASTRDLLRHRYGEILDVVIPPPKNAVIRRQSARDPTVRDRHIAQIRSNGRMAWQAATGYNQRSRIETQIGRWKGVIGPKLKSRSFSRQITKIQLGQKVLNTMTALGRAVFERIA